MKIVLRIVVAILALMMLTAPTAVADEKKSGNGRHPSVVPADRVAGNTGGRIIGDYFVRNLSLPTDESPFGYTVNLCQDLGRRGKVLVPAGGLATEADSTRIEMTCTVKVGRPVVLIMTSADCSTREPVPFRAFTAAEQRACAIRNLDDINTKSIILSVDGGRPVDIHQPRFFKVSKQRNVVFPQNAVFQAEPGAGTFVAAGWMAQIRGLKKGDHTVTATTTYPTPTDDLVLTFVVHLKVVGGGHH